MMSFFFSFHLIKIKIQTSTKKEPNKMKKSINEIPDEFICPLTLSVMKDPCMVIWGPLYEKSAIFEWIVGGNHTCPLTRKELFLHELVSNYALKQRIHHWNKEQQRDDMADMDMTDQSDDTSICSEVQKRGMAHVYVKKDSLFCVLVRQKMNENTVDVDELENLCNN
jgi:U-box domain